MSRLHNCTSDIKYGGFMTDSAFGSSQKIFISFKIKKESNFRLKKLFSHIILINIFIPMYSTNIILFYLYINLCIYLL